MEFDLKEFLVQIFNFVVIFFLLRKFLWKRFLTVLDERREKISKEFKTIEDLKSENLRLQEEYKNKLQQIEETARKQIQTAVQDGQRIADEIRQDAQKESQRIIQTAQGEIQFQLKKAKEELKSTVIDLTMKTTEAMIREKLNPEIDKKLVENLLAEISSSNEK